MMSSNSSKTNSRGFFSLFRRGPTWREIFGYFVGDIREEQPVAVAAGATVVGNIYAPQVMVVGLLSGSVVGREVTVQAEGQIWGDIYAVRLHVEPGGVVRGWINTLAEAEYGRLQNSREALGELSAQRLSDLPDSVKPEHYDLRDAESLNLLRQLQQETAVALAARNELEETFDQRLAEIAGDVSTQLTAVREELKTTKSELLLWQEQARTNADALQQRETQLERQSRELNLAQETLTRTNQDLEALRESYAQKETVYNELVLAKAGTDTHLHEALNQVDTLTGRVHNIEIALQASLTHSSDQEDALVRWQELAEATEAKVKELEKELASAQQQIEQSSDVIGMLRQQRKQMEEEWQALQQRHEELEQKSVEDEASYRQLLAESDATIQSLTELNGRLKADMQPLQHRNGVLLKQMEMAKEKFFKQEEKAAQLRRQNSELEAKWQEATAELDRIAQQPTKILPPAQLDSLTEQLTDAQAELQTWREKAATLDRQLHEQKSSAQQERQQLKEELRHKQMQLVASETELQQHHAETTSQGQRLAEMQSLLIERELELQQALEKIGKQQLLIKQIKQITTQKISSLEAALSQAQKAQI